MFIDSLTNMITKINQGIVKKQIIIVCKKTKKIFPLLNILFKEGFIDGFRINQKNNKHIDIILKYYNGYNVINKIQKISKPGRPIYIKQKKLINKLLYENLHLDGILIVSTVNGLMSHKEAIIKNLGGKIICKII